MTYDRQSNHTGDWWRYAHASDRYRRKRYGIYNSASWLRANSRDSHRRERRCRSNSLHHSLRWELCRDDLRGAWRSSCSDNRRGLVEVSKDSSLMHKEAASGRGRIWHVFGKCQRRILDLHTFPEGNKGKSLNPPHLNSANARNTYRDSNSR